MSVSRNQDRPSPATPDRYAAIHRGFGWKVPKRFNMAQACCGQWAAQPATARHVAIREHVAGQGLGQSWTFAQLQTAANRLSRVLKAQGVVRGDRVVWTASPQMVELLGLKTPMCIGADGRLDRERRGCSTTGFFTFGD